MNDLQQGAKIPSFKLLVYLKSLKNLFKDLYAIDYSCKSGDNALRRDMRSSQIRENSIMHFLATSQELLHIAPITSRQPVRRLRCSTPCGFSLLISNRPPECLVLGISQVTARIHHVTDKSDWSVRSSGAFRNVKHRLSSFPSSTPQVLASAIPRVFSSCTKPILRAFDVIVRLASGIELDAILNALPNFTAGAQESVPAKDYNWVQDLQVWHPWFLSSTHLLSGSTEFDA